MQCLIVFYQRSDTLAFSSFAERQKLPHVVVSTPREISASCGISIKIDSRFLPQAKNILRYANFASFAGVFEISHNMFGAPKLTNKTL